MGALRWSSMVATCLLVFAAQMGVQTLPFLLSGELFASDVRALCKGLCRGVTSALLILGSFIVSSNQFFGEPIQCDLVNKIVFKFTQFATSRQPGGGVSEGTLKTYCWMYSSFNIPAAYEAGGICGPTF